jgi:LmbE family N-acetylglucosaminyl deacetylase
MLVIAPHPDDETLGAGGLIAAQRSRGIEVTVVAVTDGEMAYGDTPGLGQLRQKEQENALDILGVQADDIVRLRLPDSSVQSSEACLANTLADLVSPDTDIVAPWRGDFHPDHEACGRVAECVSKIIGATLTSHFLLDLAPGAPQLLSDLDLVAMPLSENQLRAKRRALLEHRSQLSWPGADPILPESLLEPARRSFEVFLIA